MSNVTIPRNKIQVAFTEICTKPALLPQAFTVFLHLLNRLLAKWSSLFEL